nr:hypothetical protein [Candidatus Competibacter phosphatis]
MDEKTLGRTHLAGHLNAGFLLDPIEEGLDGLTYPRDGARPMKRELGSVPG